ncbi:MAG: hypothetical protein LBK62_05850 [Treponema sp.]|nr:hypothetical protein [Treponema sp.]
MGQVYRPIPGIPQVQVLFCQFQIVREYPAESLRFKPVKQPGYLHGAGYVPDLKERFKVIPLQFLLHLLVKVQQGGMLKEKDGKRTLDRI